MSEPKIEAILQTPGEPESLPLEGRGVTAVEREGSSLAPAVAVFVVALVPRILTIGHFFNLDEWLWMGRSEQFSDALMDLDPSRMSALYPFSGTIPGIPTVWLGTAARGVWSLGGVLGIVSPGQHFADSASAYTTAQAMVAIATSFLIGFFVFLVAKWIGCRVAVLAGAILATEPFWVSLGSILHTDELVALFGLTGLVALSWTLGLPSGVTPPPRQRRWMIISGLLLVLAPLTKLSGLAFGIPAVGMILWAFARAWRDHDGPDRSESVKRLFRHVGWMVIVSAVVVVASYPALLFAWGEQQVALRNQLITAGGDRKIYFLGHFGPHPDARFYPITLSYHSSAWFFVLGPIGVMVALLRRTTRRFAFIVLAWAIVPAVSLLRSGLVYARYGLVLLGPMALAAACAVHPMTPGRRWWMNRGDRIVTVGVAGMLAAAVFVAPWGNITFNPILAAYRKPAAVLPIGWGESIAQSVPIIAADVRARGLSCDEISVSGMDRPPILGNCTPRRADSRDDADYVIVGISTRQRFNWTLSDLPDDFEQIDVIKVRGVKIAEVWRRKADHPKGASQSLGTS